MIIAINAISAKSGGMKTYADNLIKTLQKYKKHTFHVWLPQDSKFTSQNNVIIHKTHITYSNNLFRILYEQLYLRKEIKKIKAKLLYSTGNFGIFFIKIKQIFFLRNLLYFDSNYLKYIYPNNSLKKNIMFHLKRFYIHLSTLISDKILVGSNHMKNSILTFYPRIKQKCIMIYEGTKLDDFLETNIKVKNIKKTQLLYVSKYYAHKNPGVVADAIKILLNKKYKIKARITMNLNTPHAKSMATWIKDYNKIYDEELKNYIELGEVPYKNVFELYKQSDIFIFPSIAESYGHPMIEAMASGLPVITADTKINNEICGNSALYFSPFDAKELAEKIIFLINNPEERYKLIKHGKNRIKRYKWTEHVKKLIKIFEQAY